MSVYARIEAQRRWPRLQDHRLRRKAGYATKPLEGRVPTTGDFGGIRSVLEGGLFTIIHQPIFALASGEAVGFEALCRVTIDPKRGISDWLADAARAGLRQEFEVAAAKRALDMIAGIPAGRFLAVNISPDTAVTAPFLSVMSAAPAERIVLEITEQVPVLDYAALTQTLEPLRRSGMKLAIDDAGAGYSSPERVIRLRPDLIKLDMNLIRNVDTDPVRRAMVRTFAGFAATIGGHVVAEGIETKDELRAVTALGIAFGQGYLLGRPGPIDARRAPCGPAAWF